MDVFDALADANRRQMIELLAASGQLSASDISKKFKVTPSAVSQHLKILRDADVVSMQKKAQQHLYSINTNSLQKLEQWTRKIQEGWEERFSKLDKLLKKIEEGGDK